MPWFLGTNGYGSDAPPAYAEYQKGGAFSPSARDEYQ
jgi:hypothetical protein